MKYWLSSESESASSSGSAGGIAGGVMVDAGGDGCDGAEGDTPGDESAAAAIGERAVGETGPLNPNARATGFGSFH